MEPEPATDPADPAAGGSGRRTRRRILVWLLVWALTLVGLRATLLAAEICPPITAASAREAAVASAEWIAANQADDGRYLYDWNRVEESASGEYNLVRHAGTTMALYQLVLAGEDRFLATADRGLQWLLDNEVGTPDAAAFTDRGDAKLGTAALVTVGLAHRRLATGDPVHDELMNRVGTMMVGQQRPDGSMLELWDPETGPVPDKTSLYATGEALWAIALLHEAFPDRGYDDAAWPTLDYMATVRDEEEDVWPKPWADQWAAYSLHEMVEWGLSDVHIDYARRLAAQWGVAVRWESQRNGGIDELVHAPEPIAAGQGTWLEGIAMLRQLSEADDRLADLREPLADRLACGAGRMAAKQVRGTGVVELDGGWFVDDVTRVDGQQHALSGLLFAETMLIEREAAGDASAAPEEDR